MEKLVKIQDEIRRVILSIERDEKPTLQLNQLTLVNNNKVFYVMRKVFQTNLVCLHLVLTYISDSDLLNFAASCKTLYRIIYSPFGYRLIKSLRPLVITLKKVQDTVVHVSMYDFRDEKQGAVMDDDQDDLEAHIMAMNTNILAMMQKSKEIDAAKKKYDIKSKALLMELGSEAKLKEEYMLKNQKRDEKLQKLETLNKDSQVNIRNLIESHNKTFTQRMYKIEMIEKQKDKLLGQKELLVKKLKALMKETEEEQIMSTEVNKIIKRIGTLVKK